MNIAVLSNTSWSIFNFRRHLIHSLKDQGHRVVAIAPEDEYSETINSWTTFIPLKGMQANRKNPFADAVLARNIRKTFLAEKIDLVFSFTPKGNIYSAFAAQTCRAICVPTVNGLGTGFEKRGLLSRVLIQLYKQSFRKCRTVFFQNPDDALLFQKKRILKASSVKLVNGSGVDLTKFTQRSKCVSQSATTTIAFVGRLIASKGFMDFIQAADYFKSNESVHFQLAGSHDSKRSNISLEELETLCVNSKVEYMGFIDDMGEYLNRIGLLVFPSYYPEGLPRILLEGLASGLSIITCDTTGCREAVEDGWNGFLVPPRDPSMLAKAIQKFLDLSQARKEEMAANSRCLAEKKFSVEKVVKSYLDIVDSLSESAR